MLAQVQQQLEERVQELSELIENETILEEDGESESIKAHFFQTFGFPRANPCTLNADVPPQSHQEPRLSKKRPRGWNSEQLERLVAVRKRAPDMTWSELQENFFKEKTWRNCEAAFEQVTQSENTAKNTQRKLSNEAKEFLTELIGNSSSFSSSSSLSCRVGSMDWIFIAEQLNMHLGGDSNYSGLDCLREYNARCLGQVPFSKEEDTLLLNLVDILGEHSMPIVADLMQGKGRRSARQCALRFRQSLKSPSVQESHLQPPNKTPRPWNSVNDARLMMALQAYPQQDWRLIQRHFPDFTDIQCRERWCRALEPRLAAKKDAACKTTANNNKKKHTATTKARWTSEEVAFLEQLAKTHCHRWALVAKEMNAKFQSNRTAKSCRLKFNRKTESERGSHPEDSTKTVL